MILSLSVPPAALTGCAALVAGGGAAGAVAYVQGELRSELECPLERCQRATESAIVQLELEEEERRGDGLSARYVLTDADDKRIEIALRTEAENITDVRIRVGTFGDESKSRRILRTIEANL